MKIKINFYKLEKWPHLLKKFLNRLPNKSIEARLK